MRIPVFSLVVLGFFGFATIAWSEDASSMFLQAYQEYQAAEKCERDSQLREALNRYATTIKTLESIQKNNPDWQTMVVDYRLKKAHQSMDRLRETIAKIPSAPETVEAPLPGRGFDIDIPEPAVNTRPRTSGSSTPKSAVSPPVDNTRLNEVQGELSKARKKIRDLEEQLDRTAGTTSSLKMEVEKTKTELVDAKSRLAQAEDSLQNTSNERDALKRKFSEGVGKRIAELQKMTTNLETENELLQEENKRLSGKLVSAADYIKAQKEVLAATESDRQALAKQRDQAVARTNKLKENSQEIDRLQGEMAELKKQFHNEKSELEGQLAAQKTKLEKLAGIEAENKNLASKLQSAEKLIAAGSKSESQQVILEFLSQIDSLKENLQNIQGDVKSRDAQIKDLMSQLNAATTEAARLKLDPKPTDEDKRLAEENELLKTIVLRQLKEVNQRQAAAAKLESELHDLEVKSDSVLNQVSDLKAPLTPLSEEEKVLFREPSVFVSESAPNQMAVSMLAIKKNADPSDPSPSAPAEEARTMPADLQKTSESQPATDNPLVAAALPANELDPAPLEEEMKALPPKARELAALAAKLYKDERYFDAVIIYRQALEAAPGNLFVIANLAVAKIQTGKLRDSQLGFEKVLEKKPRNLYALTNLSIVYSKQKNFEKAISTLNEILEINPKNAVAHNYMAVALGKTGKAAEAEEYFKRSIALDPNYGTAYFNLAIMYINSQPPQIDLAGENYEKAKSLGEEPNMAFEKKLAKLKAEAPSQPTPQP